MTTYVLSFPKLECKCIFHCYYLATIIWKPRYPKCAYCVANLSNLHVYLLSGRHDNKSGRLYHISSCPLNGDVGCVPDKNQSILHCGSCFSSRTILHFGSSVAVSLPLTDANCFSESSPYRSHSHTDAIMATTEVSVLIKPIGSHQLQ